MRVGDLVRYRVIPALRPDFGLVVDILSDEERPSGDNVLVQWSTGKSWHVAERWVYVVARCGCNRSMRVV